MKGLLFDSEILIQGLPVRWRLKGDTVDRFGLIEEADPIYIVILAYDNDDKFDSEQYCITQMSEFELLGEWE